MSTLTKILLLTLTFALSAFVFHKSYRVKPGKHVGPFYIWKTTITELRSEFGEGESSSKSWQSQYSKEINTYTVISYPNKGLIFTFFSEAKSQKNFFGQIEITKKCDAITEQGISIHSTRADVFKIYGQPNDKNDTINRLNFREIGISFKFDNYTKAQLSDTITSISIFKPAREFIYYSK
jgi:hypothetical protein